MATLRNRSDDELERLRDQVRRLEAQNANLEDKFARFLSQGPSSYYDRPMYADRAPYFDRTGYYDRSGWPDRYAPAPPPPPPPPPAPLSPVYGDNPFTRPSQSAENGADDVVYLRRRRPERDRSVSANRPRDSDDAVEGAKDATEKPAAVDSGPTTNGDGKPQKKTRIKTVINKWDEKLSKWGDIDSTFDPSTNDAKIPATFRRHLNGDNEKVIDFEEVEVHSRELKDLLLKTSIHWEEMVNESDQSLSVHSPFYKFVQDWDAHEESCEPRDSDNEELRQARTDLQELMALIKGSDSLKSYFRSRDGIKSSKKISFDFLWTLFPHGTLVYGSSYMNQTQMFEVRTCSAVGYKSRFLVQCSAFDWDGSNFTAYTYDFWIKEYTGERPINSLAVFPIKYYGRKDGPIDHDTLQENLLTRGRKYVSLCTKEPTTYQCQYEGTALVTPTDLYRLSNRSRDAEVSDPRRTSPDDLEVNVTSIEISGSQSQVIVDNFSFLQSEQNTMTHDNMPPLGRRIPTVWPDCLCPVCKTSPMQQWKLDPAREPSDIGSAFSKDLTRLRLLPPRLLGFALKEKVWGQFLVNNLTRILPRNNEKREGPFWKDLELDKESKDLLWAFMQQHKVTASLKPANKASDLNPEISGPKAKALDIIEGKGQGLVILLHGPPGVGKTLTAETIAITTGRPLLTVSVSEIGITAQSAEKSLTPVLAEATRWEAVLLMDEADVFVEERTRGDMQRNAMVSVLLRCLEYYRGIIILTTNRAKTIDAALQSRIQLAIQYKDLTQQQKINIYKNKLGYIPDEEIEDRQLILENLEYSPLVHNANKANGRQIRNIVTYARALATSENKKLTLRHLVRVDEVTSKFTESMKESFDRQRAKNEVGDRDR